LPARRLESQAGRSYQVLLGAARQIPELAHPAPALPENLTFPVPARADLRF